MKILYLDLNIQYHNPTRNNIVLLLKSIGELYCYGLGYQSNSILEDGVDKFYETNGPFDFIITNEHIVFGSQNIKAYKRNYYFQFNNIDIEKNVIELNEFFHKSSSNKIVFLLESDYYNFKKERIDRLISCNPYIIGFGESLISSIDELEDLKKESFGDKANDNWFNFVKQNSKIIELPHFVNSNEFYFETLSNRKNIIYIAGTNYYHRKMVMDSIKKSNYKTDNIKIYNKIYSLMRKIHLKPDSHPILMRLYNTLFRNEIEHSKYTFTCGSALNWPIRKFFEIPTMGSLLFAKPFKNADKLGFIDNKTYIKSNHKNIIEKIDFFEKNPKVAQEIATNGQNMIWKNHSLDARVKQLKEVFKAILIKKYNSSYWNNGEFYVK